MPDISVIVINVINKQGVGGIETLVHNLTKEIRAGGNIASVFLLAKGKIALNLLGARKFRVLVVGMSLIRLVARVLYYRSRFVSSPILLIFNHAECHVLVRYLVTIFRRMEGVTTVVSLHQSPEIYPRKLRRHALSAIEFADVAICYSGNVIKRWSRYTSKQIYFLMPFVKSCDSDIPLLGSDTSNSIKLLHIGRNVEWKNPLSAVEFAHEIASLEIMTELQMIGIRHLLIPQRILENHFLSIKFLGHSENIRLQIADATAVVNFFDAELSAEVVGVAALTALSMGVPVIIEDMSCTSFLELNGIYTREQFKSQLEKNRKSNLPLNHQIRLTQSMSMENQVKLSIRRYFDEILQLTIGLNTQ
jgi:glycosyltransferase involved in cell wall biosynthesis